MAVLEAAPRAPIADFIAAYAGAEAAERKAIIDGLRRFEPRGAISGYYVYALIDPRGFEVFYVGKGKGRRYTRHAWSWKSGDTCNVRKLARIGEIFAAGLEPIAACLIDGLSEDVAIEQEALAIRGLRRDGIDLTNATPGTMSRVRRELWVTDDLIRRVRPVDEWKKHFLLMRGRAPSEYEADLYRRIAQEFVSLRTLLADKVKGMSHGHP